VARLDPTAVGSIARYLDPWLAFRCEYEAVPGVQAAIFVDETIVLASAHGVADVSTGETLTDRHLFRIASHSKTFTATAIMQLVESGSLRLDDTVSSHLPELGTSTIAGVTLRELLSHAGGAIRDGLDGDFWQLAHPFPDREALLAIAGTDAAIIAPNERFKYSNIGYGLLGLVIESATGETYANYVEHEIVERLGLADIGPEYDPMRAIDYAAGHSARSYLDRRLPIDHVHTGALAAATGWYSTATDLVRYAAAHFVGDERLLTDASKREMQHPAWKVDGGDTHYALGFNVTTIGTRTMIGHGGGYPGHITRTFIDPADRLAVCVFTNAIDGPALAWATAIVKLIDLAVGGQPVVGDVDLGSFCGRFATLWGVYDIVDLGGRLVQLDPAAPDPTAAFTRLEVVDADTLVVTETPGTGSFGERFRFTRDATGTVTSIRSGSGLSASPMKEFRISIAALDRVSIGSITPGV
jgi:CubicO group peptidase (beta-lactamase class C family)